METLIKLKHADVVDQLNQISQTLEQLNLPLPSTELLGENKLRLTAEWIKRENEIHNMIEEYKRAVQKNIEDTRANIDYLREQDESITHLPMGPLK
ncbi:DUF5344 family protein [Metabacillus sp. FJAT-52054]|uniref:DUF5344 family protein n=1 Tax=Metabacillus sediminis TaxID=3117746 RepID=A0ABZ2NFY9_9BACI